MRRDGRQLRQGPDLDRLTHRIAECPAELLEEPRRKGKGAVCVDAVVHDVVLDLGGAEGLADAVRPLGTEGSVPVPALRLALIASWLLADECFRRDLAFGTAALEWLIGGIAPLARAGNPLAYVSDPDRREELARSCLAALGLLPRGETAAQAEDRLQSLDSVERARLIKETRAQRQKARELREAMQRKEAEEAAAKASREW